MSGSSGLSDITAALPQEFDRLQRNVNRMAVTLGVLPTVAGAGKNCAWDAEMDGATANSRAEGSDFSGGDLNVDSIVPATLSWAEYGSAFQITQQSIDASASSIGAPDGLKNLFINRVASSLEAMASKENKDAWTGTGLDGSSNPNIVGLLGGMLGSTGSYANIDSSSFPLWKASVSGGVGALTVEKIAQMEANVFKSCGVHPNFILMDTGTFSAYQNLFETNRRIEGSGPGLVYNTSTTSLFFQDIPVIRDKDGYSDSSGGTLIMGHTDYISKRYLRPSVNPDAVSSTVVMMPELVGSNGDSVQNRLGIPVRVDLLAKNGPSHKIGLTHSVQLVCTRRNAFGVMTDITG